MALRAEEVGVSAEAAVKRAAIAADTAAVMTTPVKTGRARGNWLASIGQPEFREVEVGGPTEADAAAAAQGAMEQARAQLQTYTLNQGSIFLCNSLPYILVLEHGSSVQRPEGMTTHALAAAQYQLRKARLLK